ncbi:transcription factor PHYTOCHROME INTERACTING FACTOR-LIKE 15-like [Typha angustifolia]|uniref:transcription factor PHYTOCHROME INTERACTING FACTOR-LIKE 15-like n=1 Tax=Typha angustifolia TaxID=59011 RepID=UPI003C2B0B3C
MPLSEFHQATTTSKVGSASSKIASCSSDLSSFMPENESMELLWDHGPIVMQGQSNRPKKGFFPTCFPASDNRVRDKDNRGVIMPKIAQFESTDEMFHDVPGPSSIMSSNAQNDDSAPWIHYPSVDDSLPNDYCSVFLSEFSGSNLHSPSTIFASGGSSFLGHSDKSSNNMEPLPASKSLAGSSDSGRIRSSQLFELSQQCPSSIRAMSSTPTDWRTGGQVATQQGRYGDLLSTRLQKKNAPTCKSHQPSSSLGLLNFPHFSRPVTLAKANLHNIERLRSNEKAATTANGQSTSGFKSSDVSGIQEQLAALSSEKEIRSSANISPEPIVPVEQMQDIHQHGMPSKDDNVANSYSVVTDNVLEAATMASGRHEIEKGPEAVVASSSVCSGNSVGAASNDPKHRSKRKPQEGEDSDIRSEDLEDESVGLKRPATVRGTNTKRSRAAQVHNLSERRRRDRINEKMCALQELIPNCNKVDKASMLDEAIEYLKTLQLQLQMMTMGSGLCMPPMMLPPGMQQMAMPPMAHLSQVGVGMSALGYGMGMLDVNGSPGYPLIPVPPLHGTSAQFPCPTILGAQGSHATQAGSIRLPIYGIPGQGIPSHVPCLPPFGSLSGLPMKANFLGPEITAAIMVNSLPAASVTTCPSSSSKNQQQHNLNVGIMHKTGAGDSLIRPE